MNKIKSAALLATLLSFQGMAAELYQVTSSLYQDGELVASPVMLVEANTEAAIQIGDDVRYQLIVSPQSETTAALTASVKVGTEQSQPSLLVKYDTEASLQMGAQKLVVLVSKKGS